MSEAKTDARLDGYAAQVFPRRLHELNIVYDRVGGNGETLKQIGKRVPGFQGIERVETSDVYYWFWAQLYYTSPNTRAAVLFPWAQDWGKQDGLRLDRSIAVYTSGMPSGISADELVEKIIMAFGEFETGEEERIKKQNKELARMPAGEHKRTTFAP